MANVSHLGQQLMSLDTLWPTALLEFDRLLDLIFAPSPPIIEKYTDIIIAGLMSRKIIYEDDEALHFTRFSTLESESIGRGAYAEALCEVWEGLLSSATEHGIQLPLAAQLAFHAIPPQSAQHLKLNSSKPHACFLFKPSATSKENPSFHSSITPHEDNGSAEAQALCDPNSEDLDYWDNLVVPMVFSREHRSIRKLSSVSKVQHCLLYHMLTALSNLYRPDSNCSAP